MLASILRHGGLRATSAGNVGTPLLEAVLHPEPYDVLAVELSSFQLHWQRSISAVASAVLNVAPDHLDWHGSYAEYLRAKGKIYENTHLACIYNVADIQTEQLVMEANVVEGCRAIGFTTGIPAPSMVGVVEDVLADRAFVEQRQRSAAELCTLADLRGDAPSVAPHYVANALAAAALARAYGVGPHRGPRRPARLPSGPAPHRRDRDGQGRPLRQRLQGDQPARGRGGDPLLRLRRVGRRRPAQGRRRRQPRRGDGLASARRRPHRRRPRPDRRRPFPDTRRMSRVVDLSETDTGVMDRVVREAARLAQPGDVVLLAPAAASMDMFTNYGARGDAFEEAVRRHAGGTRGAGVSATTADDERGRPAASRTRPGVRSLPVIGKLESPLTTYYLILGATSTLVVFGLIMVFSASSVEALLADEALLHGLPAPARSSRSSARSRPAFASRLDVRWWKRLAFPVIVVSILLLAAVIPFGRSVNGNQQLARDRAGPVPAVGVREARRSCSSGPSIFANKSARMASTLHVVLPYLVPICALVIGLILAGHDLGTAMVLLVIIAAVLLVAGRAQAPLRRRRRCWPPSGSAMLVQAAATAWAASPTSSTRRARPTPTAWCGQSVHGLYALADGGWWGVGLGASKEKWAWLSEAHNDFIFAIIGEELGLPGTLMILVLFGVLGVGLLPARQPHPGPLRPHRRQPASWRGCSARPSSTSARSSVSSPSSGCRCRSSRPEARRSSRPWSPSASCCPSRATNPGCKAAARRPSEPRPSFARGAPVPRPIRPATSQKPVIPLSSPTSVLLAGGGSAGHVSPLLALADALRRRHPDLRVTALGTQEGLEARLVPARGYDLRFVPKVPLPRRPSVDLLRLPGRLKAAVDAAGAAIDESGAEVVVGFGGYVSTPAYLAARRRRVPIVIHEQNTTAGIANRLGARWAAAVATTFASTSLRGARRIGMPLRHEVATLDRAARRGGGARALRARAAVAHAARHRRLPRRPAPQRHPRARASRP